MRHLMWTRAGRQLELPETGQRVYKAAAGQQNVELPDGSFAPYVWSDDARTLRYADLEARFVGDGVEFWRGPKHLATTRPRVQRRTARGWIDEAPRVRVERLSDEDHLEAITSARVAIVFEAPGFTARHILVAGGRHRARGDTELRVHLPGEYRVVVDHDLGPVAHVRQAHAESYLAANGWRVAWEARESRDRTVRAHASGLSVELASVARARGQSTTPTLWVSPDTYGPATNAGGSDDVNADANAYLVDGFGTTGLFFVDDSDTGTHAVSWRFASVDLGGIPASIDAGTLITLARENDNSGANGVVRFRCQASNTPATASSGDRPYARAHNASFDEHTFPASAVTQTPALVTAIGGLVTAGYSYSGGASDAIVVTAGASNQWGITAVSWRCVGADETDPTVAPATLTIVYTPAGGSTYTLTAETGVFILTGNDATLTGPPPPTGNVVLRNPGGGGNVALAAIGGGSYTLDAAAGTFALTGVAATLTAQHRITAELGTLALTGIDAGLNRGRRIAAELGTFTLTGLDAALGADRRLTADSVTFALTGLNAGLLRAVRMPAGLGAFVLTGTDTGLVVARRITAVVGAFTLVGNATGLTAQRKLTADVGAFAFSGVAALLIAARRLSADVGTFAFVGSNADLTFAASSDHTLAAETGTFTLVGNDAALRVARRLEADVGAFALSGINAELRASRFLTAAVGAFSLTGSDADIRAGRALAALAGGFTLTGAAADLRKASRLATVVGAFTLTGLDATLRRGRTMAADPASFVLVGNDVGFTPSRHIGADPGVFALAGNSVFLRASRTLIADRGAFALAGSDVTFGVRMPAQGGSFALTGTDVAFIAQRRLIAETGVFIFVGVDADLIGAAAPTPAVITWAQRSATIVAVRFARATEVRARSRPTIAKRVSRQPATIVRTTQKPATTIISRILAMTFHVGDTNDIDAEFRDGHTNALVDPTTVTIVVQTETQALTDVSTTYTYGVDALLTRVSIGKYRASIPCTEAGKWEFCWKSPGPTGKATEPGYFDVVATI